MSTMTTAELVHWLGEQTWSDFAQSLADFYDTKGYLTEKQEASARKMHATCQAKAAAKKAAPAPAPAKVDDGYEPAKNDVHVIDGTYYRVHEAKYGGYLYGAVWNGEQFVGPKYDDRAKGLLKKISKATLATAEEAAAFGHINERCCFCSTKIETPESKSVGYGPDCAASRGLPWGVKVAMAAAPSNPAEQLVVEL